MGDAYILLKTSKRNGGPFYAVIDEEDLPLIAPHRWYYVFVGGTRRKNTRGKGYAQAFVFDDEGRRSTLYMHRVVARAPKGVKVDHEDGDGLNNRRRNVRLASSRQNAQNARVSNDPRKTSRFKGVGLIKATGCWQALITVDSKTYYLGRFADEVHAALAYDEAALRYFGEFAATNASLGLLEEYKGGVSSLAA